MVAFGWLWHRAARERWARHVATPEISGLMEAGEFAKAVALIEEASTVLPKDPTLARFWMWATEEESIDTVPAAADVSIRPYHDDSDAWKSLGRPAQKTSRAQDRGRLAAHEAGLWVVSPQDVA
jgi:hypothetical protein